MSQVNSSTGNLSGIQQPSGLSLTSRELSSCALVMEGSQLAGIFTERDLVRLTASGIDLSNLKISEVMTQPVITLPRVNAQNALSVLSVMRQHQIRHLPVVNEQEQLLGLITKEELSQVIEQVIHSSKQWEEAQLSRLKESTQHQQQEVFQPQQAKALLSQSQEVLPRGVEQGIATLAQKKAIDKNTQVEETLQLTQFCIERATEAIAFIAPNGRYLYVNDAICRMLNYSREELLSMSVYDVNIDVSTPALWSDLWPRVKQKGAMVFESRLQSKDGRIIPVEISVNYLVFKGQEYIWGFARDLSERKQAQKALLEQESRLRLALDAAQMGSWECNAETGQIIWSERTEAIFGFAPGTFPGDRETYFSLVHPEDRDMVSQAIANSYAERSLYHTEFRIQRRDGTMRWVAAWADFFQREPEQSLWMSGVVLDITERKQTEALLQHQAQREQALNRVIQAIRQSLNLETIFSTATAEIGKLLQVDQAEIIQYLPEQQMWLNVAEYRHSPDSPSALGTEIPDRDNPIAAQIKQGEIVRVNDTNECQDEINRAFAQTYPGAWLIVPLQKGSTIWGSLSLHYCDRPWHWQDSEIELARAVADQLAIAIHQAELYQQVRCELAERQRAEAALRESEQFLRSIYHNAHEGIFAIDVLINGDFQYVGVNPAYERLTGISTQVLRGKTPEQVFPSVEAAAMRQHYRNCLEAGARITYEEYMLFQEQVLCWFTSLTPLRDETGRIFRIVGTSTNVTELKHTEAALRQSEERFRILSASAPIGIYQTDAEGRCVYTNKRWQEITGLTLAESLGDGWERSLHPEDREAVFTEWNRYVHEGGEFSLEFRFLTPWGDVRWVLERATAIRSDTGEIIGYVGVNQDITDRKQVETALRESEQRLQAILDNSPAVIYLIDRQNRHLLVSRSYAQLLSKFPENLIGKSIYEVWPTEIADIFAVNNRQVLQGNQLVETEEDAPHSDGLDTYITLKFPLHDAEGMPYAICGIATDITERKRAEEALRTSERRYRALAEKLHSITSNIPIYICELKRDGRIIFINRTYKGLSRDQVIGTFMIDWFPEEQRPRIQSVLEQAFRTKQVQTIEYSIPNAQGEIRSYITQIVSIRVKEAEPTAVWIASDITERKQAEQKILEQAALIDIATDAIFVQDLENQILFWSQGAERLYGQTAAETVGQTAHALFHQECLSPSETSFQTTIEKGSWQGELKQVKKDGTEIMVASRWTLVRDQFGQAQSILVVNTDITEKKQLEQQFYRAQRLESLGTLASGIAHDLNNIFTPILGIAQLLPLKLPNLDERTQELLESLEDSAKRGANMVKQILTFARGAAGKRISLQVEHILFEVVKIARQTFPKSIEIHTDIPARTLSMVKADPTQLHQVFMNLAVNARDAMLNGGSLNFSAENLFLDGIYARMHLDAHEGNYVAVTISDTGIGIPIEQKERIFEPFFTTKEVGRGTGLGLSTVLGIVKNHGGFLQVLSEVNKGTQFKVYLPAADTIASQPSVEKQLPRGNGELVMVVDDEATVQQITQESLTEYNYRTLVASDGIEAIALYAEHQQRISIVLMDLMMPNMDGLTAIRTLQKINPLVKIVATSGLTTNAQQALSVGVRAFLAKPYTAKELLHTLSALIAPTINNN